MWASSLDLTTVASSEPSIGTSNLDACDQIGNKHNNYKQVEETCDQIGNKQQQQ